MSRPNLSNIQDSKEFIAINGDQPERHVRRGAALAQWNAALAGWGGVVEPEDVPEDVEDALAYVAQHIGFGEGVLYRNMRASALHGSMPYSSSLWVAYPEAGKGIRAPLNFLTDPARDDSTIANMQIKAVRGGHAFEVYNSIVNPAFRKRPEDL